MPAMTERQESFINSLLAERELPVEYVERAKQELRSGLTKSMASSWIENLLTWKKKAPAEETNAGIKIEYLPFENDGETKWIPYLKVDGKSVPKGGYAIEITNSSVGNDLAFYQLWIGDRGSRHEGKWNIQQRLGPNLNYLGRNKAILHQIALDPSGAATRWGLHIGTCGICSRTLTNRESRERGIGPVCAARWGW